MIELRPFYHPSQKNAGVGELVAKLIETIVAFREEHQHSGRDGLEALAAVVAGLTADADLKRYRNEIVNEFARCIRRNQRAIDKWRRDAPPNGSDYPAAP